MAFKLYTYGFILLFVSMSAIINKVSSKSAAGSWSLGPNIRVVSNVAENDGSFLSGVCCHFDWVVSKCRLPSRLPWRGCFHSFVYCSYICCLWKSKAPVECRFSPPKLLYVIGDNPSCFILGVWNPYFLFDSGKVFPNYRFYRSCRELKYFAPQNFSRIIQRERVH